MAVISLVRVGFQTNPTANNGAREALTGAVSGEGTGPFKRINTGLYLANNADGQSVAEALCKLGNRLLGGCPT